MSYLRNKKMFLSYIFRFLIISIRNYTILRFYVNNLYNILINIKVYIFLLIERNFSYDIIFSKIKFCLVS